jgi:Flp pilus assembly protein TadG
VIRNARPQTERGSITVAAAIASFTALVLCGLVIDGGYTLAARQRAANTAENAARAGANALAISDLRRNGAVRLDPNAATTAAREYLDRAGLQGTVHVSGDTVRVTVDDDQPMTLLGLVGIRRLHVTGHATARAVQGVTGAET